MRTVWRDLDKHGQDLSSVNMENAFLWGCNLQAARFGTLRNATFVDCDLLNADISESSLSGIEMRWTTGNETMRERSLFELKLLPESEEKAFNQRYELNRRLDILDVRLDPDLRQYMIHLFWLIAHGETKPRTRQRLCYVSLLLRTQMELCHDEVLAHCVRRWHPDPSMARALGRVLRERSRVFDFYRARGTIEYLYGLYREHGLTRAEFGL